MKNKIFKIVIGVIVVTMFLVGCGSSSSQLDTTGENIEGIYPLTIVDSYDNEVIISEMPDRVISIAPSITELIFALEVEERLVGRTEFCNYPLEVDSIESIGSLRSPNIEKIVELQPDLIIASTHFEQDVYDKFIEMEIDILVLDPRNSFDGVYDTIEKLGYVFNINEKSENLIGEIKSTVDNVLNTVKDQRRPSVYYVVGFGEQGDFTAGGGTFINDMLEMAGADNIASEVEGWSYSLERLVEKDPDLIIVSKYNNMKEEILKANGYKELTAIKEGMVFEIDNNLLDRQGPRNGLGLKALAEIIHPDLFQ